MSAPLREGELAGDTSVERFLTLDGLRGVAAVAVMIYHALLVLPSLSYTVHPGKPVERTFSVPWLAAHTPVRWLWPGVEAVCVFFVLSGFVLTRVAMRPHGRSWRAYYPSRLTRLYVPAIAAVILGSAFVRALPDPPATGFGVWMHFQPDLSLSSMLRDSTLMRFVKGAVRPLWSLRWEVVFSVLLPAYYLGTVVWRRVLVVKLIALFVVVYLGAALPAKPLVYLPMFAVGALMARELPRFDGLARRVQHGSSDLRWWVLTIAGLSLLTADSFVHPFEPPTTVRAMTKPAMVAGAAILVFIALYWQRARGALEHRSVQWLGAISFSLYLIHEPIAVAFGYLVGERHGLLALPLTIAASLVAASVFRRLVERPSHHISRHIAARMRARRASSSRRSGDDEGSVIVRAG